MKWEMGHKLDYLKVLPWSHKQKFHRCNAAGALYHDFLCGFSIIKGCMTRGFIPEALFE